MQFLSGYAGGAHGVNPDYAALAEHIVRLPSYAQFASLTQALGGDAVGARRVLLAQARLVEWGRQPVGAFVEALRQYHTAGGWLANASPPPTGVVAGEDVVGLGISARDIGQRGRREAERAVLRTLWGTFEERVRGFLRGTDPVTRAAICADPVQAIARAGLSRADLSVLNRYRDEALRRVRRICDEVSGPEDVAAVAQQVPRSPEEIIAGIAAQSRDVPDCRAACRDAAFVRRVLPVREYTSCNRACLARFQDRATRRRLEGALADINRARYNRQGEGIFGEFTPADRLGFRGREHCARSCRGLARTARRESPRLRSFIEHWERRCLDSCARFSPEAPEVGAQLPRDFVVLQPPEQVPTIPRGKKGLPWPWILGGAAVLGVGYVLMRRKRRR